jgi:ribonucleotide monophosphatase NagD (HAD superfamily)
MSGSVMNIGLTALNAAQAGLVTTGTSSAEDAATCAPEIKPELVVSNMFELIDLLKQADSAKV